ncbi:MAG: SpoIIE family protein phosphatase [Actinobacteria bacterium]|nr:SpoIIE family protein phosphatase [Actinomycetota bacterium]
MIDSGGEADTSTDDRAAVLQRLTAALAPLLDEREIAAWVLEAGIVAVGGQTGSLCLLTDDGENLEIVAQRGYTTDVVTEWKRFALAADLPASECVRSRAAVFITSAAERDRRYPSFVGSAVTVEAAHALLPLLTSDGGALGALVISFTSGRSFPADEREYLTAFADQCGIAIERARLYYEVTAARDRFAFLDEASQLLGSTLDVEATLHALAELAVPRIADWCAIYVHEEGGGLRHLVAHRDPDRLAAVERLAVDYPVDLDAPVGAGSVLRTGERYIVRDVAGALPEIARDERHLQLLEEVGFSAAVVVPIIVHGKVWGAMALVNDRGRSLASNDAELASELASRASVAVANAGLFEERSRIARALQSSLLPPTLPDIPGLELAARYLPAGTGAEVGGDFYDVFQLAGDRWMISMGDVCGKGVDAAVVTGLARHTIRSLALEGRSPAEVLRHLNDVLLHDSRAADNDLWSLRFCTAVVLELRTTGRGAEVTMCSAGHPLPWLVAPDGVAEVGTPGTVLGVENQIALPEATFQIPPGAALVVFTDGVIERRVGNDFFEDRLPETLSAVAGLDSAEIADGLEKRVVNFGGGRLADDLAILVVRAT